MIVGRLLAAFGGVFRADNYEDLAIAENRFGVIAERSQQTVLRQVFARRENLNSCERERVVTLAASSASRWRDTDFSFSCTGCRAVSLMRIHVDALKYWARAARKSILANSEGSRHC